MHASVFFRFRVTIDGCPRNRVVKTDHAGHHANFRSLSPALLPHAEIIGAHAGTDWDRPELTSADSELSRHDHEQFACHRGAEPHDQRSAFAIYFRDA